MNDPRGRETTVSGLSCSALDPKRLEELREILGGQEFLSLMIRTFLDDAPVQIEQLHTSLQDRDVLTFTRIAHGLKSNCADFGALTLQQMFRSLELMGRSEELAGAEQVLSDIDGEYERVQRALNSALAP